LNETAAEDHLRRNALSLVPITNAAIGPRSAAYIVALPKSKQRDPEWQAATEALLMAAEDRGPLMHAHVGMMPALSGEFTGGEITRGAKPIPEYAMFSGRGPDKSDSSKERHWESAS
jgi:hypothetical protein